MYLLHARSLRLRSGQALHGLKAVQDDACG